MPIASFYCEYCHNLVEVNYPWSYERCACPKCDGSHRITKDDKKGRENPGGRSEQERSQEIAAGKELLHIAKGCVQSEEIHLAGIVYWGRKEIGQFGLNEEQISELIQKVEGLESAMQQNKLLHVFVGNLGVLAVGRKNLYLIKLGPAITDSELQIGGIMPNQVVRRGISHAEALISRVPVLLASNLYHPLQAVPADADCKGGTLFLNTTGASQNIPTEFCAVGQTSALEFTRAILDMLPLPSASNLAKQLASSKLQPGAEAIIAVFSNEGGRNSFFKTLGNFGWKKERSVLRKLGECKSKEVQRSMLAYLAKERASAFKKVVIMAALIPIVALGLAAFGWGYFHSEGEPLIHAVIAIAGGSLMLFAAVPVFTLPIAFWSMFRYSIARRYFE